MILPGCSPSTWECLSPSAIHPRTEVRDRGFFAKACLACLLLPFPDKLNMKIKQLLALLFSLAIAPLVSSAAQVDYFLKLDGIDGESTEKGHANEIEVASYSWGVTNPTTAGSGGGAGAGKVVLQDFHFVKQIDKSSPKLLFACATGKHIKSAVLTVRKGNGRGGVDFLVITLEDVLVSSYQTGGNARELADSVSLSFAKATMKTADGTTGEVGQTAAAN